MARGWSESSAYLFVDVFVDLRAAGGKHHPQHDLLALAEISKLRRQSQTVAEYVHHLALNHHRIRGTGMPELEGQ
jgi:hypothetical protein